MNTDNSNNEDDNKKKAMQKALDALADFDKQTPDEWLDVSLNTADNTADMLLGTANAMRWIVTQIKLARAEQKKTRFH